MNDRFNPESAEGVFYTRDREGDELPLFALRDIDCNVDVTYADAIARGTEAAKAEFGPRSGPSMATGSFRKAKTLSTPCTCTASPPIPWRTFWTARMRS